MKINDAGLRLIKSFEGCKLTAYRDIVGVLTIGYGTTGDKVKVGMQISQEDADEMLVDRLEEEFEPGVESLVEKDLTENQFSALVSFAYNLGLGALGRSTLLKLVKAGDMDGAAEEFVKWSMAGGKQVAGLLRRREAEKALFLQD